VDQRRFSLVAAILALSVIVVFSFRACTSEKFALKREKPEKVKVKVEVEPKIKPEIKGRIAIVLDDFGYTKKNLEGLKKIGVPVTMAVLPDIAHTKAACDFARKNGFEVILHLPMEPEKRTSFMEEDTILGEMDDRKVGSVLNKSIDSVYPAVGASNHMGSRGTQDRRIMSIVLSDLKDKDMYFLDSRTTGRSVCEEVAGKTGISFAVRDVFIDNELDEAHIRQQMDKAARIALKKGTAVAIGHDRTVTVEALGKIVPDIREQGIEFVKLSEIVKVTSDE
jgi:polysaccharide deacetylase 2 family uncharacterized protein YibQ